MQKTSETVIEFTYQLCWIAAEQGDPARFLKENYFSSKKLYSEDIHPILRILETMGITLTIKVGKEAGSQKHFDQDVISIGRTSDNDLVLLEQGVSRKHARIVFEMGKYLVEDLGSSNGVMLNGDKVERGELANGMTIGLGPVVLGFEEDPAPVVEERPRRTRSRNSSSAIVSAADHGRSSSSSSLQRRSSRRSAEEEESAIAPQSERGSGRRRKSLAETRSADQGGGGGGGQLSVADRARILRENKGVVGQIKIFMAERTPKQRTAIQGGAIVFVVALVCGIIAAVLSGNGDSGGYSSDQTEMSEQHFLLTGEASEQTFGYGPKATTQTRYELHCDFEVSESIKAVYYLKFASQDIESNDEVSISLNNVPIGIVSGGLGDFARNQKIKLPTKHLVKGQVNEIFFDQQKNTRSEGEENWAISEARVQMIPLPNCDVENKECEREAYTNFKSAEKKWNARNMASENAYKALVDLNTALLFLEAEEQKPDFYVAVQQMIRDVEMFLDRACSKTLLLVKRDEEMSNWTQAQKDLKDGLLWFPGPDHRCHNQLKEMLSEYE